MADPQDRAERAFERWAYEAKLFMDAEMADPAYAAWFLKPRPWWVDPEPPVVPQEDIYRRVREARERDRRERP